MNYPTELVAKAKYEIEIFERPSTETSAELVAEVVMLRSLVRDMRAAALGLWTQDGEILGFERMESVIAESKQSVPDAA
jgi:hypothetical protein